MPRNQDIDTLVDACLDAHRAAQEVGNPEVKEVARLLLYLVGRQIADGIDGDQSETASVPPGELAT